MVEGTLFGEFQDGELEAGALLDGEGAADAVGELQLGLEVGDVHRWGGFKNI